MTRRKQGGFEPEQRLWLALIPLIMHPLGCIIYGVRAGKGIHWIGLAFGLSFVTGCFPIGSTVGINYIIDSYNEIAGEALATMIIIRNSIDFGFTYGVVPWLRVSIVQNTYIAVAFIGMGFWILAFGFIVYGKRLRKISAPSYWNIVEKHGFTTH